MPLAGFHLQTPARTAKLATVSQAPRAVRRSMRLVLLAASARTRHVALSLAGAFASFGVLAAGFLDGPGVAAVRGFVNLVNRCGALGALQNQLAGFRRIEPELLDGAVVRLVEERPAAPGFSAIGGDQEKRIARQRFHRDAAGPAVLEIGELDLVQRSAFDARVRLGPGFAAVAAHQQDAVERGGHACADFPRRRWWSRLPPPTPAPETRRRALLRSRSSRIFRRPRRGRRTRRASRPGRRAGAGRTAAKADSRGRTATIVAARRGSLQ